MRIRSAGPMFGLLAIVLPSFAGCSVADLSTTDRLERGLVIILPGIEGRSPWNIDLARGLNEGGVQTGIQIFDWGTAVPGGMLINLTDYERNQRMAQQLKDHILAYRRKYPGRSVHLIGHSGGGGLAVLATEMLPPDTKLSSVILLAPALSPKHDLRAALRRTRFGIFNYFSKFDQALLGLGTSVAGTIDRDYGQAAGAVGFTRPKFDNPADDMLYTRLHQIQWRPEMRWYGHFGGHMEWTHRGFVKRYLAPLITDLGGGGLNPEDAALANIGGATEQ
jgi:pimeloyl-ACP methyl ester carboxylesterase